MKVWIAHGNVVAHDAIGTDILGMHDVLIECGLSVSLVGDHFSEATLARADTIPMDQAPDAKPPDCLIYHHSIYWEKGEELLRWRPVPRLMKYHNITPAKFYEEYSPDYTMLCADGRKQTQRLVSMFRQGDRFAADSEYNAAELRRAGAELPVVVPPFTHVAHFLRARAETMPEPPYSLLFVGRMAPHKGHFDLLSVVAAYVSAFGPAITLTIVGGLDDLLKGYGAHIRHQIRELGIDNQVTILPGADDETLRRMFADTDVFLCMSQHEGFCVPVIEAQASGVPVVSTNATALAETIGPGQLVIDPPREKADFALIARLIHRVCIDAALRRQVITAGHRNVLTRFTPTAVAERFMESLAPLLEAAP
jgi:glycosyltransferase involved in cell wall biosynthesis